MLLKTLYLVGTPIGNLSDISERAIDILSTVDLIAAENTRHTQHLLKALNIQTPMISFHAHNEETSNQKLIEILLKGQSIALVCDAGMPLISDPGYPLVTLAQEHGISVVPIPGACALICALVSSGLPTDRFVFEGFLPAKKNARQKKLRSLASEPRTLIFYEAPHRIVAALQDSVEAFGGQRKASIARELTKKFETIKTETLSELLDFVVCDANQQKGEFVLLVAGAPEKEVVLTPETEKMMTVLLESLPKSQAAQIAAKITQLPKRLLYEYALSR
jgi:16S rRNA (cytidine1402-2'-O)-methyltransferase